MMKLLSILGIAAALAVPVGAYAASRTCTLTGQEVDPCCCVAKDQKLVCTLTGESLERCCCK